MTLFVMRKDTSESPFSLEVRLIEISDEQTGQRLDNFLLHVCKGVPKSHLYKIVRSGEVRVNKARTRVDYRLELGDLIRIPPLRLPQPAPEIYIPKAHFPIIFEDEFLLVINKPSGLAVHGGSGVAFGVIEQMRRARPEAKFLELVHRLDRDTSGLLMLAKKRSVLVNLHTMLRHGLMHKFYLALVEGKWVNARQHVRLPLLKWITATGERRVRVDPEGKNAHTIFTLKQPLGDFKLLQAELCTGRTHQIRVHLAAIGFPIVGDDKYSDKGQRSEWSKQGLNRLFLHAHQLRLTHPLSGEILQLEAPIPQQWRVVFNQLELNTQ